MSINDAILSKRGPLARVWLAATLERKVSKQNFLAASIPQSVEAIVGDATMVPIALRLSGQLLLGVARMYSRKAKYLMDDATETLSKVRLAFRATGNKSRDVDMAADQQTANRNAITLQENEFDTLYQEMMNMNWEDVLQAELAATSSSKDGQQQPKRKRTTATNEEITLPDHEFDFEAGAGVYDLDLDYAGRGIDSQQFAPEDFNLDLDLDVPLPHEQDQLDRQSPRAPSVEMGRDAPSSAARKSNRASSPRSQLDGGFDMDLDLDAPVADDSAAAADASGFDAGGADFQFEAGADFDLGLNMGDVSGAAAHDDQADGQATPRAGTPTGEPSEQDPNAQQEQENADGETTPQADKTKKRRTKAVQKQIVDSVTELQSPSRRSQHSQSADDAAQSKKSALISPPHFLPRDPHRLALMSLDINAYLPMLDASKQFIGLPAAAGTGFLAPELQELFKFDVGSRKRNSDNAEADAASRKRQRTAEPEHEEGRIPSPELGRRQSLPPLSDAGRDFEAGAGPASDFPDLDVTMQDDTAGGADFSNMHDDFRFELESHKSGGRENTPGSQRARSRSASVFSARSGVSRRSQYLVEEDTMPRGDASSLLAPFDDLRLATSTAASASSRAVSKSPSKHASQQAAAAAAQAEEETVLQGKWSKSSRVAIQILNGELASQADESVASGEKKKLSFEHAANKGSRRAAASFFFELLVLSSRNCVKVDQSTPYGDMQISGTPALFEAAATLPPVSMSQQDVAAGSSQPPSRAASVAPSQA